MVARGIGSFVGGFQNGYGFGEDTKDRRRLRTRQAELDRIAEEQRGIDNRRNAQRDTWDAQDQEYRLSERARAAEEREYAEEAAAEAARRTDEALGTSGEPSPEGGSAPAASAGGGGPNADPAIVDAIAAAMGVSQSNNQPPLRGPAGGPAPRARGIATQSPAAPPEMLPVRTAQPFPIGGEGLNNAVPRTSRGISADPVSAALAAADEAVRVAEQSRDPQAIQRAIDGRNQVRTQLLGQGQTVRTTLAPRMTTEDPILTRMREDQARRNTGLAAPTDVVAGPAVGATAPTQPVAPADDQSSPLPPAGYSPGPAPARQTVTGEGGRMTIMPQPGTVTDPLLARMQGNPTTQPLRGPAGGPPPRGVMRADPMRDPAGGPAPSPRTATRTNRNDPDARVGVPNILAQASTPATHMLATALRGPAGGPQPVAGRASTSSPRQAETVTRSWIDEYRRVGAPYVQEQLLRRGRVEDAAAWGEWIDAEETEAGMEAYGRAAFYASRGDMDGFADAVAELYNNEEFYPDGLTVDRAGSEFVTDPATGDILGARVTFVDGDGNRMVQTWEGQEELVSDVLNMLAPEKAFELHLQRMTQAAEATRTATTTAREAAEAQRKRIADIVKSIAENDIEWGNRTPEEQQEIVRSRIALEDGIAANATGQPPTSAAPPPDMRF